jgi:hypothetical protein
VNKGDFLVCDGKYSQSVGQNKDGEQVTYHNLSATTIVRVAGDTTTAAAPAKQAVATEAVGDDFPF